MHVKDRDSAGPKKKRVVIARRRYNLAKPHKNWECAWRSGRRTVAIDEIVAIGEFYCASNSKVRLKRMFVYPKAKP